MIPVCEPLLDGREKEYVNQCLDANWISSGGEFLDKFERGFAEYCGCRHGIATTSGTTALHLALEVLGVGPGDEVIVPDLTIAACAFAVLYTGATPVFVDCDPDTFNIDTSKIEAALSPRTKAIMPVHLYGRPYDVQHIEQLALKYSLLIVEDAAEAHGAEYRGRKVGGFGHIGCFSFYANKIITCFPRGTKVLIKPPVGGKGLSRMRAIEDIGIGDVVLTYNETTSGKEYREVTETFEREYQGTLLELVFSNKNSISLTPDHPVYVVSKGWVAAKELSIGDKIIQYIYRGLAYKEMYKGQAYEEILGKRQAARRRREHSRKIQERHKEPNSSYAGMYTDEWRNKIGAANSGRTAPVEARERTAKAQRQRWANMGSEEYEACCEIRRQVSSRPEVRQKKVQAAQRLAQDPEYRRKVSEGVRRAMQKDSYWVNYTKAMNMKPNKPEKFLTDFLGDRFPNEFGYNGDYRMRVRIDRLIPDFVHQNGKNKVIDILGRHWHSESEYIQRATRYRKHGFDSLMLWEDELKDEDSLHQRIETFLYNPDIKVVELVEIKEKGYQGKVHNIETEENHNYFAHGILVHNCGEGGMLTTNSAQYADRARSLRDLAHSPFLRFLHLAVGFNYRMTNIQAAIGVAQLENIEKHIATRLAHAAQYTHLLKGVPGLTLVEETRPEVEAVSWMYCLLAKDEGHRDALMLYLADKGIQTRAFFIPMHQQPMFKDRESDAKYPVAIDASQRGFYLPSGTGLEEGHIRYICDCIRDYMS